MTYNRYIAVSDKIKGKLLLVYQDERLHSFILDFNDQLDYWQWKSLVNALPYNEEGLDSFQRITGLKISREKTSDKIALFCRYYEQFTKVKYKVSAADSGKIVNVEVTEQLLQAYFKSDNFLFKNKYSIANFVKYYNELRAEAFGEPAGKSKHPHHYDRDYERSLSGSELSGYWEHLRSIGLKPVRNRLHQIVDWK